MLTVFSKGDFGVEFFFLKMWLTLVGFIVHNLVGGRDRVHDHDEISIVSGDWLFFVRILEFHNSEIATIANLLLVIV